MPSIHRSNHWGRAKTFRTFAAWKRAVIKSPAGSRGVWDEQPLSSPRK